MDNYSLILLVSAVLACLAFVALVIFLIITLIHFTRTLKRTQHLIDDTEECLYTLFPLINLAGKVGACADSLVGFFSEDEDEDEEDKEAERVRKKHSKVTNFIGALFDTAQWALITFNFFGKKNKRRSWRD